MSDPGFKIVILPQRVCGSVVITEWNQFCLQVDLIEKEHLFAFSAQY